MTIAKTHRVPPPKIRTCADFLNEWQPRAKEIAPDIELDFSFRDDAITATDMRVPSALRTGVLYKRHEVEDNVDRTPGDFAKRIDAFLAKGARGR